MCYYKVNKGYIRVIMAESNTTLKSGDNLPPRGKSNKNRILEAMRAESFEQLTESATRDECEIAFFRCIVKRAANPDDKDSAMMLKFLGDKGWSNLKPTFEIVSFALPEDGTAAEKMQSVVQAVADGVISIDVGQAMGHMIRDGVVIEEGTDLKNRIEQLELLQDKLNNV
jgi:hypothetical protein